MKTISKIVMIMLVATVVAAVFFLAVNNGSIASGSNASGQPPVVTSNSQSTNQPMARPEGGDRDGGSITRGLPGVLGTLAKLAGITIIVLLLQKGFSQLERRKLISA